MDENDGDERLTIGQLSRRTGLAVRTIRYWSDIGAVPPAGRSSGGYRLYDAGSVARLDLVRTLRELGLGLNEVRRVLQQEVTVADVAAAHVLALDAQIRALRLSRAVLSSVARRHPGTEEMALMNKLARLSAQERRQIISDFVDEVFGGLAADPQLEERMRAQTPDLPDDPSPEQVDAWVELAELVQDPQFRQLMRRMAEHSSHRRAEHRLEPGTYKLFAKRVGWLVGEARERGVAPESPEAAGVLDRLLEGSPGDARRREVREQLASGGQGRVERYWQLMAVIKGETPRPPAWPDFAWLLTALQTHEPST